MDDFDALPIHTQNALKRAGIASLAQARALGRAAISKVPGVGPLALARLFPSQPSQARRQPLSPEDLRRARRWFETLQDVAPLKLSEDDRLLAEKLAAWSEPG
jgi:hypothetical protein